LAKNKCGIISYKIENVFQFQDLLFDVYSLKILEKEYTTREVQLLKIVVNDLVHVDILIKNIMDLIQSKNLNLHLLTIQNNWEDKKEIPFTDINNNFMYLDDSIDMVFEKKEKDYSDIIWLSI